MSLGTPSVDRVADPILLSRAWKKVACGGSARGIDRVSPDDYAVDLQQRLSRLAERLADGTYKPSPARRIRLENDPGRRIAVPTVEDRIVQRALLDVLGPFFEPELSHAAYAYRPGRSVGQALRQAERYLEGALHWAVRTDISAFFDSIDRELLLVRLRSAEIDESLIVLIRKLLRAGTIDGLYWSESGVGVPQGSPLSPLLSNLYLSGLDAAMTDAGYGYVRYGDDILLLARTSVEAADGLALLGDEVSALNLQLNQRKTWRGHVGQGFSFLGSRIDSAGVGYASSAYVALEEAVHRALSDSDGDLAPSVPVVSRWSDWYGAPRPHAVTSLGTLAACALAAFQEEQQPKILSAWARRRAEIPNNSWSAPPSFFLELARLWTVAAGLEFSIATVLEIEALRTHPLATSDHRREMGRLLGVAEGTLEDVISLSDMAVRLGNAGRSCLADAARRLTSSGEPPSVSTPILPSDERHRLATCLVHFCGQLPNVHSVEGLDKRGHRKQVVLDRPLSVADIVAHLGDGKRRGMSLVGSDRRLRFATIDITVKKKHRIGISDALWDGAAAVAWEVLVGRAHDWAVHLTRIAEKLGVPSILEEPDARSRRVWFRFDSPLRLHHARILLGRVVSEAGEIPKILAVVSWPRSDRLPKPPGHQLIIPLGLHPRTKHRSRFVDRGGRAITQKLETSLKGSLCVTQKLLRTLRIGSLRSDNCKGPSPLDVPSDLSHLKAVFDGCAILRSFAEKAHGLRYLEGAERQTVIEALGHLPTDVRLPSVRWLVEPAGRSNTSDLERRLRLLHDCPISCAGIRRRHPGLTARVGCSCRFLRLWGGVYPTPVLHCLKPEEILEFRQRRAKVRAKRASRARAHANGSPGVLETNPDRSVHLPIDDRNDVCAEEESVCGPEEGPPSDTAGIQVLTKKFISLKEAHRKLVGELELLGRSLSDAFDEAQLDRVDTPAGVLVRLSRHPPKFALEL